MTKSEAAVASILFMALAILAGSSSAEAESARVPCKNALEDESYQEILEKNGTGYVAYSRSKKWCYWSSGQVKALEKCYKDAQDCILTAQGTYFYKEPTGSAYEEKVKADRELYQSARGSAEPEGTSRSETPAAGTSSTTSGLGSTSTALAPTTSGLGSTTSGLGISGQPLGSTGLKDMAGCIDAGAPLSGSLHLELVNACSAPIYLFVEDFYTSTTLMQSCDINKVEPGDRWGSVKRERPARYWACEASDACYQHLRNLAATVCG